MSVADALAASSDQPGQAGPLGLFITLALGVAIVLLVRSMGKHLRRIPPTFDPPPPPKRDTSDEEPHSAA